MHDEFLTALLAIPKMTPTRFRKLMKAFVVAENAWKASALEWLEADLEGEWTSEADAFRKKANSAQLHEKLVKLGVKIVIESDENFPKQLKTISAPPAWLYVRGELHAPEDYCLTVVGPRKMTDYGKQVTDYFVQTLAREGLIIVSGLALGVDAQAHRSALAVKGKTIAVLGNGIDEFYPPVNRTLGQEILANDGTIISEYAPGAVMNPANFPVRNRIVAGLSRATLVTEASEKSGSLITAHMAVEQGKSVFAIPGSIFSDTSSGTNRLISAGEAQSVTTPQEILQFLQLGEGLGEFRAQQRALPNGTREQQILAVLGSEPIHTDVIARTTKIPIQEVGALLSIMELQGYVLNTGGQRYVRK